MVCPAPNADGSLVASLTDYLECHASALGQNGFEAAASGFFMTAMLTGCLTIYVALIGYRLILGQPYTVREALVSCVRVGLIVTFCTRWPSYEAVFYKTAVEGPQEIAGQILQASGLPVSTDADMAERLQQDYQAIQIAELKDPSPPPPANSLQAPGVALPKTSNAAPPPPPTPAPAARGLSAAGLVFLTSTIGSQLAVHLATALLMAIGPLVLLLALFDSLVGLFENWVAALAATMLATVGITIVTELELGFVEARLSQFNTSGGPALTDEGLLFTALLFSMCVAGVVVASGLVGRRLRFLGLWSKGHNPEVQPVLSDRPFARPTQVRRNGVVAAAPSRAAAVANAVSIEGRRERLRLGGPTSAPSSSPPNSSQPQVPARNEVAPAIGGAVSPGLGYSLRRPASANRSTSHRRRG